MDTDKDIKNKLMKYILDYYLGSSDFNGIPVIRLASEFNLDIPSLLTSLRDLITERKLSLVYGDRHPNPHIKAFPDEDVEGQVNRLPDLYASACAYPAKGYPQSFVNSNHYKNKPYDYELALGSGQLEHRVFDLSVLEAYRNDPRYLYENWDIGGRVCISDEFFESGDMAEHDQILLQTFGFCYDKDMNRAVAVFLRYLKDLSPEHQQIWKAKEISEEYFLHPDYHRTSLIGDFPERFSLADAFLLELDIINQMCAAMKRPALFKEAFKDKKPRGFSFLVRPTLNEFNSFIHTLDKMMSDNINKDFFRGDLVLEYEEVRSDGKVIVTQKSTIALLDEWISKHFVTDDRKSIEEMISAFRKVRKIRQKPAHTVHEDKFDQRYFHEQREVFKEAYSAIRTIRLILSNHPAVTSADIEINQHLSQGKIWTF